MKILVIGSGGREHALVWKIKKSPLVKEIYCAPGNGGIAQDAECVDIAADNIKELVKFAKTNKIDLTVVGPEAPLVNGIVDAFLKKGLKVFGPTKKAAQLEGSKVFAKEFMQRWNIPTAPYCSFKKISEAMNYIKKAQYPLVIKADGLAAGKGVIICKDFKEGEGAINKIMKEKAFQGAGKEVIIEDCLVGEEASIIAISDGEHFCILETSQDHKRIFDDDIGPNTGGMGAYSPAPIVSEELAKVIEVRIIEPTIRGMHREGMTFQGVLYAGLMITDDGPMALEYNVRFGDPEIQAILPKLKNDIVELMDASIEVRLNSTKLVWDKRFSVCVVMSSGGYPAEYDVGFDIKGLDKVKESADAMVFHAGTKMAGKKIVTAGGRVLGVVGVGKSVEKAIERAYENVDKIKFKRCFFRRDIGAKAMKWVHKRSKVVVDR